MILSDEEYKRILENMSYDELIKERNLIVRSIREYEKEDEHIITCPSPEDMYLADLHALSQVSLMLAERFIAGERPEPKLPKPIKPRKQGY